jgi:hypothetical protein
LPRPTTQDINYATNFVSQPVDIDDLDLSVVPGKELPDLVDELLPPLPRPAFYDGTRTLITPSNNVDDDDVGMSPLDINNKLQADPVVTNQIQGENDTDHHEDMHNNNDLDELNREEELASFPYSHPEHHTYPSFHANDYRIHGWSSQALSSAQKLKLHLSHYLD